MHKVVITDFIADELAIEREAIAGLATVEALDALHEDQCEDRITVEELFRQAHVLSIHCPLTPETRHLVNADSLEWLTRGTFLVNTARGGVVDTAAIPARCSCRSRRPPTIRCTSPGGIASTPPTSG